MLCQMCCGYEAFMYFNENYKLEDRLAREFANSLMT